MPVSLPLVIMVMVGHRTNIVLNYINPAELAEGGGGSQPYRGFLLTRTKYAYLLHTTKGSANGSAVPSIHTRARAHTHTHTAAVTQTVGSLQL